MCVGGGGGGGGGGRRAGVVYPKALYYARAEKKLRVELGHAPTERGKYNLIG